MHAGLCVTWWQSPCSGELEGCPLTGNVLIPISASLWEHGRMSGRITDRNGPCGSICTLLYVPERPCLGWILVCKVLGIA